MLQYLVARFTQISPNTARSQVCAVSWCSMLFLLTVSIRRAKGKSRTGRLVLKTDKLLALPLTPGPDQLNLTPVSLQV